MTELLRNLVYGHLRRMVPGLPALPQRQALGRSACDDVSKCKMHTERRVVAEEMMVETAVETVLDAAVETAVETAVDIEWAEPVLLVGNSSDDDGVDGFSTRGFSEFTKSPFTSWIRF